MSSSTPVFALPYPLGGEDVRDGNDAIQALAARLEALLNVPSGARNVIRNGDFSIAQRGNGPYNAGGLTGVDGWLAYTEGAGTLVPTRVAAPLGAGMGSAGAAYHYRIVTTGRTGATDQALVSARIEDVRTLAGQRVTLSFRAAVATGTAKIAVVLGQNFGTGGSASVALLTSAQVVTVTTTPAPYSLTFDMPSIAGKVLGTDGKDHISVTFFVSAGANFVGGVVGNQNNTFDITDVQLEAGDKATPFERLSQQAQLAWCQRYLFVYDPPASTNVAMGTANTTQSIVAMINFSVPMRTQPNFSLVGVPSYWNVLAPTFGAQYPVNGIAVGYAANRNTVGITFSSASAPYAIGQSGWAGRSGGGVSGIGEYGLVFSAEL